MIFLEALRMANIARQKEWQGEGTPLTGAFHVNELAGEAGEACNILKKFDRQRLGWAGSRATLGGLEEELADVVICCDLLSLHYKMPLNSWPSFPLAPAADYSMLGAQLAARVGRCCHVVVGSPVDMIPILLGSMINEVVFHTKRIGDTMGVELERVVRTKFNMTSEKIGLATRMVW